jgi:hypothetical protein
MGGKTVRCVSIGFGGRNHSDWQGKKTGKVPYPTIAGWVLNGTGYDPPHPGKAMNCFLYVSWSGKVTQAQTTTK